MSGSKTEYRLKPQARQDLAGIWRYTFVQWGKGQADRYIDQLNSTFAFIAANPKIGHSRDDIREGYRCRPAGRHLVYYVSDKYGVMIVRVLHERMSSSRYL